MKRSQVLDFLARVRREEVIVTTMSTQVEWPGYSSGPWDIIDGDAMGHGASVGLGFALAQPQRQVWVLNADGSQLMTLGSLATVANASPPNLVIFVFRNDCYEITGGQPLPAVDSLDFMGIARGCGFRRVYRFEEASELEGQFGDVIGGKGPVLVDLKIDGP